jgi:type II secretory ATPase GspE/PulE/Tfp pilus assembly ATPase PilB-like protein
MLAGQAKGSYATFHAESAGEAVQRLISFGIEEKMLCSLDLVVVQKRINKIEKKARKEIRKVVEICEIEKSTNGIELKKLFDYNYEKKELEKINESERIIEKICRTFNCTKKQADKLMKKKEKLLGKLGGKATFKEFFESAENEK